MMVPQCAWVSEIVSEPDLRSAAQAVAYARHMHALVRWIGVCDGNMQEGSFRCDANVSIRPAGSKTLGTRTEVKNLNSFRFLERAIEYEYTRQVELLEDGGRVTQETRLYDPDADETRAMRSKEEANDYRYFPDPDLPPVVVDESFVTAVVEAMPELQHIRRARFVDTLGVAPSDSAILTDERATADWFEAAVAAGAPPRLASTWLIGEVFGQLKRDDLSLDQIPLTPEQFAGLLVRIEVDEIITANPSQVAEYRAGKTKLMGFLVGAAMKASGGKANPAQLNAALKAKLDA